MAVLLREVPEPLAEALRRKTWTRDELKAVEATGLFDGTHFELIEGELIDKMSKNRPHGVFTGRVRRILEDIFGREFVDQEVSIDVSTRDNARNQPQPDVVVLRQPSEDIFDANPVPEEIVLAVEIADSSLSRDLRIKARLYARARIPEYWVLDVNGPRLHVFRDSDGERYRSIERLEMDASIAPLEKPSHSIPVASLFPPKARV